MSEVVRRFWRNPRHWPTLLGLGFFRLLVFLPWSAQVVLARAFGWLFFAIIRIRRATVAVNVSLCFPEKTAAEQRDLALAHYQALALGLFETLMAWWAKSSHLPAYEIIGREHLENARAQGKGVILLTAHFTTLEICGRMLRDNLPFGCLYRDPNNPVIAEQMRGRRERKMTAAVHMDDIRGLIRALKGGHVIWYAPDQGKRSKLSAIVPFFGVPAITNTATSRLAEMTGAAVVPYFGRRLPDGTYQLTILPALDNFPTRDAEADALRINHLFEEHIRLAPAQYFWIHRRFKRVSANPGLYKSKHTGRLKALDSAHFETLIAGSRILETGRRGPKVYETADGRIVKLMRPRRRFFSSNLWSPFAIRFARNAGRLRSLGFDAPAVSFSGYLPDANCQVAIYTRLEGRPLRNALKALAHDEADALVREAGRFVASVHERGIFFRSFHFGNILVKPEGGFALIDVLDLWIKTTALGTWRRRRNFRHLCQYREDRVFLQRHWTAFSSGYLEIALKGVFAKRPDELTRLLDAYRREMDVLPVKK